MLITTQKPAWEALMWGLCISAYPRKRVVDGRSLAQKFIEPKNRLEVGRQKGKQVSSGSRVGTLVGVLRTKGKLTEGVGFFWTRTGAGRPESAASLLVVVAFSYRSGPSSSSCSSFSLFLSLFLLSSTLYPLGVPRKVWVWALLCGRQGCGSFCLRFVGQTPVASVFNLPLWALDRIFAEILLRVSSM